MRGQLATVVIALIFSGCISPQAATRGMMERLRAVSGPVGADVIVMDVAIIEQPPADPFVDRELWTAVDEQAVSLDRKAALDDNGLRVGVVGGLPPAQLQELLFSNRTSPDPHRITMRAGNNKIISIGDTIPNCQFYVRMNGENKPLSLTNSQCSFAVTPQRTNDGRIRLHFTPQIQHGNRALMIQPTEGESWSLAGHRPTERFAALSFDVVISNQQYVLIGTTFERENTLGRTLFVDTAREKPVQRLLVVRARPQGEPPAPDWTSINKDGKVAPLAFQASRTTRGTHD